MAGVASGKTATVIALVALFTVWMAETVAASPDIWHAINTPPGVALDSALDMSFLNHMPAGKHGFVCIDSDGDYYFEERPGEKIVFNGPSFAGGDAVNLTKERARIVADRLAAQGYNVVRIHLVDNITSSFQGIFNYPRSTEVELNSQAIDNLDNFIAEVKQRGIYITLDIMCSIPLHGVPGLWYYDAQCGYLAVLFPEGMEVWKSMARAWLTHVNPYTGLALKDDPVLIGVSPWNEDLLHNMTIGSRTLREWLRQDFNAFLEANGKTPVETLTNSMWSEPVDVRNSLMEYYADKTITAYGEMKDYLENELGVRAPVGGLNFINCAYVNLLRTYADVHETHQYNGLVNSVSGPVTFFPGRHPRHSMVFAPESKEDFVSQYSSTIYTQYIPSLALTQLYQKPFMLSEYTQEFPTKGREDIGLMVAAVGKYNGWDMLNRFRWGKWLPRTTDLNYLGAASSFSMSCDELILYSEIQSVLTSHKSQLTESEPRFVIVRNKDWVETHEDSLYSLSRESNLTYLVHLFKTVVVYTDRPLNQLQVIYKITPDLSADDIAKGNIPDSSRIDISRSMTLKEAARVFVDSLDDESLKLRMLAELDNNRLVSDTGELIFDLNLNTYMMNTPYMVGIVGTLDGHVFELGSAVLRAGTDKGTMTVTSMDDRPLDQSSRIIVIYTTDVAATSESYEPDPSDSRRVTYTRGTAPTLIKYGAGELSLMTSLDPQTYSAHKLDMTGRRVEELPIRVDGNEMTVALETDVGWAFELVSSSAD